MGAEVHRIASEEEVLGGQGGRLREPARKREENLIRWYNGSQGLNCGPSLGLMLASRAAM